MQYSYNNFLLFDRKHDILKMSLELMNYGTEYSLEMLENIKTNIIQRDTNDDYQQSINRSRLPTLVDIFIEIANDRESYDK